MELTLTLGENRYRLDRSNVHDLSIPIRFDAQQLTAFGGPRATMEALEAGGFIGDVARGGSCNCAIYHFCAHTSGTHTESVGHITREPVYVNELIADTLLPATLITVMPVAATATQERYDPAPQPADQLITAHALKAALAQADAAFLNALIIRTLPNDDSKRTRQYGSDMPPYFTHAAMQWLLQQNVQHLLVDMPSIDRLSDEGKLTNHHLFWGLPAGTHRLDGTPSRKTVTELIYAGNHIADGQYLLNLAIAPIAADAAPCRPLLYGITRL